MCAPMVSKWPLKWPKRNRSVWSCLVEKALEADKPKSSKTRSVGSLEAMAIGRPLSLGWGGWTAANCSELVSARLKGLFDG